MFRKSLTFLALVLALVTPLAGHAAFTQVHSTDKLSTGDKNCVEKMALAVDQYLGTYQGEPPKSAAVVALNDLMCTEPEWMMNIVLVIENPYNSSLMFGIFHIHLLPDGTLKSMVTISATWTPIRSADGWKAEWCDFLRTVYPNDFKKECAATPAIP